MFPLHPKKDGKGSYSDQNQHPIAKYKTRRGTPKTNAKKFVQ